MATDYSRLVAAIAALENRLGNLFRTGTVHEVKGNKLRVNFGMDKNGKPVLSPWVDHTNHRGGSTERRFFSDKKSQGQGQGGGGSFGGGGASGGWSGGGANEAESGGGQNVTLVCIDGKYDNCFVIPYGPNKNHPPPAHANKSGKDEETFELGDMRYSRAKDGYDWWLEKMENNYKEEDYSNESSGGSAGAAGGAGGGGQQDQQQEKRKKGPGRMRLGIDDNAGIAGQHTEGKAAFQATKDGTTIRQDKQHVTVSKNKKKVIVKSIETPVVNKPWEIVDEENPIKEYT